QAGGGSFPQGIALSRLSPCLSVASSTSGRFMEQLERVWELIGNFFTALGTGIERGITALFGSSNARYIKKLQPNVEAINALEPKFQAMRSDQLRGVTEVFRKRLHEGETLDDLLVEAFAACRESGRRYLGMRHYDVQLMGGMILHEGN